MPDGRTGKNLYDFEDFDIDEYARYRPVYPAELYTMIYDFHAQEGGQWDAAHDVATGPGVVAEELAKKFARVYTSDSSTNYLEVAEKRAARDLTEDQFKKLSYHEAPAENMSFLGNNSVNMVTAATAVHWTQPKQFLQEAQRVLKPGGTLALFSYGGKAFCLDEKVDKIVNKLFRIFHDVRAPAVFNPDGKYSEKFVFLKTILDSGMDAVELEEDYWEAGAMRMWWNPDREMSGVWSPFTGGEHRDGSLYESAVKPRDKPTQHITNSNFLSQEADAKWFDTYLNYLIPHTPENESYNEAYDELVAEVGGEGAKFVLCWPFALLLATKRKA